MGFTNFPNGITSFGVPIYGGAMIGIGKIFFVVTEKTSTDAYYALLRENKVDENTIFTTVNAAYAATTTARNDTVFVFPGVHTLSADLTWANAHTHLVGLGGPNQGNGDSYTDATVITSGTSGTSSVATITVSGAQNQFYNVFFEQNQVAATAVTAVRITGIGNFMKSCGMAGLMDNTQDTGTASSSLELGAGSHYFRAEDCTIGTNLWDVSSAINGQIYFSNTSTTNPPQNFLFKGCTIFNQSATATNPAVHLKGNYAVDRLLEFRGCTFYNFQTNLGSALTSGVIKDACGTTHMILLSGGTCQYGWTDWADVHTFVYSAVPIGSATGGTAVVTT